MYFGCLLQVRLNHCLWICWNKFKSELFFLMYCFNVILLLKQAYCENGNGINRFTIDGSLVLWFGFEIVGELLILIIGCRKQ